MIARLRGIPTVTTNAVIVDVQGVGYEVFTTAETMIWVSGQNEVTLHIYTHVTETNFDLFGFKEESEKQLFLMLIGVSGVGPKTALGIINMGYQNTLLALQQANIAFFAKAPRVGKKLAQKIIIELGNKVGSLAELDLKPLDAKQADIVAALVTLGYDDLIAQETVKKLDLNDMTVQEAIKAIMKNNVNP